MKILEKPYKRNSNLHILFFLSLKLKQYVLSIQDELLIMHNPKRQKDEITDTQAYCCWILPY